VLTGVTVVILEVDHMAKSTKPKRGSDENLFSVSGASDAIGRSRRTISKALAGVKPDAVRSGLAMWKMATIIRCINERTEAPLITRSSNGNEVLTGIAAETMIAFDRFDAAYDALKALPTLTGRRAAAKKLQPLFREAIDLMRDRDKGLLHPEHADLKADKVAFLMVRGFEGPCGWSLDQAWAAMYGGDEDETEAA
jgi:hypothetical protein